MEPAWRAERGEGEVEARVRHLVAESSAVVLATHVEPTEDMRAERGRASFRAGDVAEFLHGGADKLQRM